MRRCVSIFYVGEIPRYAHKMIASVREHMDLPLVMLTSEDQDVSGIDVDEVIRTPYCGALSKGRIEALRDFNHTETIHLDVDLIVRGSLEHVFNYPFDVCVTGKRGKGRFNFGVVFSRSQSFWADCVDWIEKNELDNWWGAEEASLTAMVNACTYKTYELPADIYNWHPKQRKQYKDDALVWHYKGLRKGWM